MGDGATKDGNSKAHHPDYKPNRDNSSKASYRFNSVGQALAFFSYQNPARAKSINLLEIERFSHAGEFENEDVWASVCLAVKKVLSHSDVRTQKIFLYYYYKPEARISAEHIWKHLKISDSRFYQLKRKLLEEIEQELINRGLMQPIDITEV